MDADTEISTTAPNNTNSTQSPLFINANAPVIIAITKKLIAAGPCCALNLDIALSTTRETNQKWLANLTIGYEIKKQ